MAAVKVGCRFLRCTSYIFRTVVPKLFVGFDVDEKSLRAVKFPKNFIFPVFKFYLPNSSPTKWMPNLNSIQ